MPDSSPYPTETHRLLMDAEASLDNALNHASAACDAARTMLEVSTAEGVRLDIQRTFRHANGGCADLIDAR